MAINNNYINSRGGTLQDDRMPKPLSEDYFRLDERSMEDYIAQVAHFAKQMTFYDKTGEKGTWEAFFQMNIHELKRQMDAGCVEPHYALLLAFLKLYSHQQQQLNGMMKRCFDFYYKNILGFKPRKGSHGTVPVFFELVKNATSAFVPKGTLFMAGKDDNGKPITYASMNDLIVNGAKIVEYKKLTSNGIENATYEVYIPLPDIDKVDGEITFETASPDNISNQVEFTTTNGWCKAEFTDKKIVITTDKPHFATYNAKTHKGNFNVDSPLLRIISKNKLKIKEVMDWAKSLCVTIKDSTKFLIENNYGVVVNKKGTLPFGPLCRENDSFTLRFPLKASLHKITFANTIVKTNNKSIISLFRHNRKPSSNYHMSIIKNMACTISLKTGKYDQIKFQKEYAEYLVKKTTAPDALAPSYNQPVVLESPIKASYVTYFEEDPFIVIADLDKTYYSYQQFDSFHEIENDVSSELLIHIEGMKKAGPLSIYFDINPTVHTKSTIGKWSYYDGKSWKKLSVKDLIRDSTSKMCQSGIIGLYIPVDNIEWIKASFGDDYNYSAIRAICTQVVELQYDTASLGEPHIGTALPAGTIQKSLYAINGIKSVMQNYNGNMGQTDETNDQFTCRVSERLRHKGRAWTAWDYERLVLEKFPFLASVQCYPTYNGDFQLAPGCVLLTVLPQTEYNAAEHKLEPQIAAKDIKTIEDYLKHCSSGLVSVFVANPIYDKIQVNCKLSLRADRADEDHFKPILNNLLSEFLAPWTVRHPKTSLYGRTVNESEIMAFISSQPFVDKLWHTEVTLNGTPIDKGTDIYPLSIGHILTSADDHFINIGTYE